MFKKETYINRRTQLKSEFQSGILLFIGNDECGMNYADNTYNFRQDSTFLYYFGINSPELFAVIDIDEGTETVYGTDFTIDSIVWMGSQTTLRQKADGYGIEKSGTMTDFVAKMKQSSSRKIHYLPPYRPEHTLKLFNFLGIHPTEVVEKSSLEFVTAVAEQRNRKSAEEIIEIEKAVDITADMHFAAMRYARPGMTEAQVMAKVHEVALAAGGGLSFPIIATINGQTLHNHHHGNTIKEGQLFLLDAGYETPLGYAGDMSSTFPVSQTFTARQKEIYDISIKAHEHAKSMLKPGVHFRDVHLSTARSIVDDFKAIGFMKGDTDEAISNGAHALFFPCGLGHFMGLDVHDMENLGEQWVGYCGEPKSKQFGLKSLRLGRKLEPGFVLTIEPGIYFIPELIDLWQSTNINTQFINFDKVNEYRNFGGIRNEEDVLITETGYRVLGKPLAKTVAEVETERKLAFE